MVDHSTVGYFLAVADICPATSAAVSAFARFLLDGRKGFATVRISLSTEI
jgi:hypothetical protein